MKHKGHDDMATISTPSRAASLPAITTDTMALVLVSGAVGTIAFDIWGQAIAPLLGLGNLAPTGLARSLLGALGLPNGAPWGHIMHLFLVGLIAYPVGWLYIARPILARVLPGAGWLIASVIYGIGLWAFAIGGVTAVAGLPFFLGFTLITWVALAGHVIYGIIAAATVVWLERRATA